MGQQRVLPGRGRAAALAAACRGAAERLRFAPPTLHGVSLTAHYTAYAWHRMGVPEAARFATLAGRLLTAAAWPIEAAARRLGRGDFASLLLRPRHRLFEDRLGASGCRTFVELGAGLSPRGTAYTRADAAVRYVEVDLPAMSALKARLVGAARGPGQRFVAGDVRDAALFARLADEVRGRGPVAVVAEGLLAYFPPAGYRALLRAVSEFLQAVGGGVFVFDANPRAGLRHFGPLAAIALRLIGVVAQNAMDLPVESAAAGLADLAAAGFAPVHVFAPPPTHTPDAPPVAAPGPDALLLLFEAWR